jgi:hypothetical protein
MDIASLLQAKSNTEQASSGPSPVVTSNFASTQALSNATRCIQNAISARIDEQWIQDALAECILPLVEQAVTDYTSSQDYIHLVSCVTATIHGGHELHSGNLRSPNDTTQQTYEPPSLEATIGRMLLNPICRIANHAREQVRIRMGYLQQEYVPRPKRKGNRMYPYDCPQGGCLARFGNVEQVMNHWDSHHRVDFTIGLPYSDR